ncbi:TetR family transcriptional regulator [Pseudomonas amygdali pv. mori]|uniref:TetR family transcriptional regulator n=1 Tax=Pseudomonas amygdali pv. mori TaxID=34065 RepID=A0A3M4V4Q5_PSEA0|nr:TetR/AcrR family transcriptional regulator [Pseudomonas amygdali]RMQ30710.1 TetR family transcriptional regulator [Pseudomonas amygdali pv. mori]RMR46688.1 TetR family transcriptional regulator [Pseudomonas amygdali pv. mori]
MSINVNKRARGRPRQFILEDAIQVGQHLFHEHGYENVSVASLTEVIGITPPSFYTAFGSKGAFFNDALRHYSATVVPLDSFLIPEKAPQTALRDMLRAAAHAYAVHPNRRGCFILEHAKAGATESGIAAKQIADENRAKVMAFLEASGIPAASHVVDYVSVAMLGMSAAAKEGWDEERLLAVVETAAVGLDQIIGSGKDTL